MKRDQRVGHTDSTGRGFRAQHGPRGRGGPDAQPPRLREPTHPGAVRHAVAPLVRLVEEELLPALRIESVSASDPVVVRHAPAPWRVLGRGNYAAVLVHPAHPEVVVKVYAPGRPGVEAEREVYRRLGRHPAYSECLHAGDGWLALRRLHGVTLYDCLHRGLPIPEQVIRDIDQALEYARRRGLHPHDVHGRNVMMHEGRGLVVDVSDFLRDEDCGKWRDLKKAYFRVYRPVFMRLRLRVPYWTLDLVRLGYRLFRKVSPDRS
ncbi:MAG TPA: hypothetical protein VHG08_12820 [Longimicrobium sp.]|nr:hypothetical protein [Longimicrobium sp.]